MVNTSSQDINEFQDQAQYHQEIINQEKQYQQLLEQEYLQKRDKLGRDYDFLFPHFSNEYPEYPNRYITEKRVSKPRPLPTGVTLYVGGSGLGNYTKIQDAIDNASDGDTVFVYDDSSPYYENIVVDKSINITGEDRNSTVINGNGVGTGILILASDVTISDLSIINYGQEIRDSGISMHPVNRVRIFNNIISFCYQGILLRMDAPGTRDYKIIGNTIFNITKYGIFMNLCDNNQIINNYISNCQQGIYLLESYFNIIQLNKFNNNSQGILLYESKSNKISNNFCISNSIDGIVLLGCLENTIKNNTCLNNMKGIAVRYSSDTLLLNNTCNYNEQGILLNTATLTNIAKNDCSHNKMGIYLYYSNLTNITINKCNDCSLGGITIILSSENILTFNDIKNGWNGLWLEKSFSNLIRHNHIIGNNGAGLILTYTIGNRITQNNIYDSTKYEMAGFVCFDYARFNYWGGGIPELFKERLVLGWVRLQPPRDTPVNASMNILDTISWGMPTLSGYRALLSLLMGREHLSSRKWSEIWEHLNGNT